MTNVLIAVGIVIVSAIVLLLGVIKGIDLYRSHYKQFPTVRHCTVDASSPYNESAACAHYCDTEPSGVTVGLCITGECQCLGM